MNLRRLILSCSESAVNRQYTASRINLSFEVGFTVDQPLSVFIHFLFGNSIIRADHLGC